MNTWNALIKVFVIETLVFVAACLVMRARHVSVCLVLHIEENLVMREECVEGFKILQKWFMMEIYMSYGTSIQRWDVFVNQNSKAQHVSIENANTEWILCIWA